MNAATITALSGAVVAILGAVGTIVALLKHKSDPAAHGNPVLDPTTMPDPIKPATRGGTTEVTTHADSP